MLTFRVDAGPLRAVLLASSHFLVNQPLDDRIDAAVVVNVDAVTVTVAVCFLAVVVSAVVTGGYHLNCHDDDRS